MEISDRILAAGASGLVGFALLRRLRREGVKKVLIQSRHKGDHSNQNAINRYIEGQCAVLFFQVVDDVGGILAKGSHSAYFIGINNLARTGVLRSARRQGTRENLNLCHHSIFPKLVPRDTVISCGAPRNLHVVCRIQTLGREAATPIQEGVRLPFRWFQENRAGVRLGVEL